MYRVRRECDTCGIYLGIENQVNSTSRFHLRIHRFNRPSLHTKHISTGYQIHNPQPIVSVNPITATSLEHHTFSVLPTTPPFIAFGSQVLVCLSFALPPHPYPYSVKQDSKTGENEKQVQPCSFVFRSCVREGGMMQNNKKRKEKERKERAVGGSQPCRALHRRENKKTGLNPAHTIRPDNTPLPMERQNQRS